ncbi:hypothetical protein Ait01nite_060260 [Actinoplanes italicus]|uniref:Uncharacterized protein n=1 Tax=Actinoplanes italicus TaxID=113567 RepID=A0A2T0K6K5_9ACTN|nr:hypothetical protein [Actinoplanes italicus]PRX18640.1 hypothetical protein CLV67_112115 [Actinoplanes italicus]GIE32981.1 hypothetical protein Ait01nite_060260 [Actinoplanes italicus]
MESNGDPAIWYADFGFWCVVIGLLVCVFYLTRTTAWWRGTWSASEVRWRNRAWLPMILALTSVFAGVIYIDIAEVGGASDGSLWLARSLVLLGGALACSLPLVAWLPLFDFAVPPHLRTGAAAVPVAPPASRAERRVTAPRPARSPQPKGSYSGPVAIRFYRPAVKFRDRFRAYRVEIDGEQVGELRHGGEFLVEAAPGSRTVRALIDWTGSPELVLDLVEGEAFSIRVEPAEGSTMESLQGDDGYLRLTVEDRL